jgi:hypothetical protein
MRTIISVISAVALLAGLALLGIAFTTPGKYALTNASAIQASTVYAEATYYAVMAVGVLLFAILLTVALPKEPAT